MLGSSILNEQYRKNSLGRTSPNKSPTRLKWLLDTDKLPKKKTLIGSNEA